MMAVGPQTIGRASGCMDMMKVLLQQCITLLVLASYAVYAGEDGGTYSQSLRGRQLPGGAALQACRTTVRPGETCEAVAARTGK